MILPFTYPWIVKKHLSGSNTVLDIGSGDGKFMSQINSDNQFEVVGVELFDDYIKKSRQTGAYKKIIKKNILKLNYKANQFDAVLCSQVIEHITKKQSKKLFRDMEKFASEVVVIGTPNGEFEQHEYDGNKLQEHHSHWSVSEFESRGYSVYGQALKFIYGEKGLLHTKVAKSSLIVTSLLFMLSYLLSPIAYFVPELGAHLIAVKKFS